MNELQNKLILTGLSILVLCGMPVCIGLLNAYLVPTTSLADPMIAARWFYGFAWGVMVSIVFSFLIAYLNKNKKRKLAFAIVLAIGLFNIVSIPISNQFAKSNVSEIYP
jgi:MFS family permease